MNKVLDKVTSDTSGESTLSAVVDKAISGMVDAQKVALGRVPVDHAGVMQISFLVSIIALPVAVLLILKNHEQIGVAFAVASFLCLLAGMIVLRPSLSKIQGGTSHSTDASLKMRESGVWARITLRQLPLQERKNISSKLDDLLRIARADYFHLLQKRQIPLQGNANDIRINIFLPDTTKVEFGEVCGLSIPEQLHLGMIDPKEIGVRFRPSEGLTGRVFASYDKAYGACRDSETSGWSLVKFGSPGANVPDGFGMTLDQVNQINPAIRWIISFPLVGTYRTYNNEKHVFGVLNLDGLNVPLLATEMTALWQLLSPQIERLAEEMFKNPKSLIVISVTDIGG